MNSPRFTSATSAFEYWYNVISNDGWATAGTLALYNVGFLLEYPLANGIHTVWREWSQTYAEREWNWYLSGNRSVSELKKFAPIWDRMHCGDDLVNSNYGYQWMRENQLGFVIDELIRDPSSRRAVITIYDGKEHKEHKHDTPCTCTIGFFVHPSDGKLDMTVHMRSNDLWYGFCNDQYCFSRLMEIVASCLKRPVGRYYHFATNLHLYLGQLNKRPLTRP